MLGGGGAAATAPLARSRREDLAVLVEQFSAGSSSAVVVRLEGAVAEDADDARSLALLGLGYQQLARETGDASWLHALAGGAAARRSPTAPRSARGRRARRSSPSRSTAFATADRGSRAEGCALDPRSAIALGALGDALLATGRHREAFRVYDRLAAIGPSVGAYARVATARQLLGRPAARARRDGARSRGRLRRSRSRGVGADAATAAAPARR